MVPVNLVEDGARRIFFRRLRLLDLLRSPHPLYVCGGLRAPHGVLLDDELPGCSGQRSAAVALARAGATAQRRKGRFSASAILAL